MNAFQPLIIAVGAVAAQEAAELAARLKSYHWEDPPSFLYLKVDGDPELTFPGETIDLQRNPRFLDWEATYADIKRAIRSQVGKEALLGYDLVQLASGFEGHLEILKEIRSDDCFNLAHDSFQKLPSSLKDWMKANLKCGQQDSEADGDPVGAFRWRLFERLDSSGSHENAAYADMKRAIRSQVGKEALRGYDLLHLDTDFETHLDSLKEIRSDDCFDLDHNSFQKLPSSLKDWMKANLRCGQKDSEAESLIEYGVRPSEWLACVDTMFASDAAVKGNSDLLESKNRLATIIPPAKHILILGAMWDWNVTDLIHRYLLKLAPQAQTLVIYRDFPLAESGDTTSARRAQNKAKDKHGKYFAGRQVVVASYPQPGAVADLLETWLWTKEEVLPEGLLLRRVIIEVKRKFPFFGPWSVNFLATLPGFGGGAIEEPQLYKKRIILHSKLSKKHKLWIAIHPSLKEKLAQAELAISIPGVKDDSNSEMTEVINPCPFNLDKDDSLNCHYVNLIALIGRPE